MFCYPSPFARENIKEMLSPISPHSILITRNFHLLITEISCVLDFWNLLIFGKFQSRFFIIRLRHELWCDVPQTPSQTKHISYFSICKEGTVTGAIWSCLRTKCLTFTVNILLCQPTVASFPTLHRSRFMYTTTFDTI